MGAGGCQKSGPAGCSGVGDHVSDGKTYAVVGRGAVRKQRIRRLLRKRQVQSSRRVVAGDRQAAGVRTRMGAVVTMMRMKVNGERVREGMSCFWYLSV